MEIFPTKSDMERLKIPSRHRSKIRMQAKAPAEKKVRASVAKAARSAGGKKSSPAKVATKPRAQAPVITKPAKAAKASVAAKPAKAVKSKAKAVASASPVAPAATVVEPASTT